jgi:hypothetical protein
MRIGFVCRRLARQPLLMVLTGLGLSLLCIAGTALILWDLRPVKQLDVVGILLGGASMSAMGLLLAGWAALRVAWVYDCRYRDLRALGRYGPPPEVVAAIDAEVLGRRRLVRLGRLPTFLNPVTFFNPSYEPGELCGHQVILTESWLLDFWRDASAVDGHEGDRVNVLRLTDLVSAAQEESGATGAVLVLIDRHGAGLAVYGTEAAVGRLLAEVLARVPWVLGRFEPQAEGAGQRGPGRADVVRPSQEVRRP